MANFLTAEGNRGQLSRAAEALNCQRSYLSRVISEELHLTPDHGYNLALYLKLTKDERDYFLTLIDFERAATHEYKTFLEIKLSDLRKKNESIPERTDRKKFSIEAHAASYFSSWIWTAIHFLTSIPGYQNSDEIADRLGLKKETVLNYLEELAKQDFVERTSQGKWRYRSGEFHAPKDSPLTLLHHQNWRGRALIDAQDFNKESLHFTGVLTLSKEDFEKIKELLLDSLSRVSQISGPSDPQECVALTLDFFKV